MASRFWTRIKYCLSGQKKNPGHRLFSLLLVAFALAAIILLSSFCAEALRNFSVSGAQTVVTSLQENISLSDVEQILGKKNTIRLMQSYAQALAGATIEFDELPDYDTAIFFTIAGAIPPQVEVTSFHFQGRDIIMDCTSPDERSAEELFFALEESAYFSHVYYTIPTDHGDGYAYQFYLTV